MVASVWCLSFLLTQPKFSPKVFRVAKGGYRCEIQVASNSSYKNEWGAHWDSDSSPAATLVSGINLWHGRQQIFVPRSAWSDLGECTEVKMLLKKQGCLLEMEGSDASDSWVAKIYVKNDHVYRREVHDGEFPENYYEVTTYVNNPPEDN